MTLNQRELHMIKQLLHLGSTASIIPLHSMLIPAQNDDDMDARSANDEESWHQSYDEQARGHKYDGNADNGKTGNHEHK